MRHTPFMLTLAFIFVSSACAGNPPTVTPAPPTSDAFAVATPDPNAEKLDVTVLNAHAAVGLERIAFQMTDAVGARVGPDNEVELVFYQVSEVAPGQNQLQRTASGKAAFFGEAMPHGGAWVVYNEFDASGPWTFDVNVKGPDGWTAEGRGDLEVSGRSDAPRLGRPAPTTDTPTLGEGGDLSLLTSDPEPVEALYGTSLAEAIGAGRPSVVHFGSPAHCEGETCAATLREIKTVLGERGSTVTFIHVESRDLADPSRMSETAQAWSLSSEPWTFVFDRRGFLVARAEGPIDRLELGLLLEEML